MANFSVHFHIFDDLDELQQSVESIPEDVTIHVLDGRYCDFDGDYSLTPGASDYCRSRPNLEYHRPPDDMLPFGNPNVGKSYRDSIHCKAKWAYYDVLRGDEWTIHMDTDERLIYLDRNFFESAEDSLVYMPRMYMRKSDGDFSVSRTVRIFKPKFWTFWLDDLMLPRYECSRDVGAKKTKQAYMEHNQDEIWRRTESVVLENLGERRDSSYLKRRTEQLGDFHSG